MENQPGGLLRTSVIARLVVMGILMVCLMIPLMMIDSVVAERTTRRDAAAEEIGGVWGGHQTIGGPILTVPYRHYYIDNDARRTRAVISRAHFLPRALDINATVRPEIRRRSLFEVVVYRSELTIAGSFAAPDFSDLRPVPAEILWREASISLGVSDPKGISRQMSATLNGAEQPFGPGIDDVALFRSGVRALMPTLSQGADVAFTFRLDLNGTRQLRFMPGGTETTVQMTSPWPHPSFVGAPLPQSREVGAAGFTASWRVPSFARGYPPRWTNVDLNRDQLLAQGEASAFGVTLVQPVDIYQQSERAVKYGALFIVMTFVIAFLWEIGRGALLHPVQYLFVGFAMCVFYLLLLSLSEHAGFDPAYTAATAATVALLSWYWSYIVGGAWHGALMGATLTALYGYLYLLLRLEDYALLAGSFGLFVMLAAVMVLTRRVNWYDLRLGAASPQTDPPLD